MARGKDRQILFHRILLSTARGLTSTTAVDWHLKVKDIEYDIFLVKNYCITVSMQKTSSVHTPIQQNLGSHELNDYAHQKISEITFSFSEFASLCKKSVHSINSFLRNNQF